MEEKIKNTIEFYKNTIEVLIEEYNKSEDKYMRKYIRRQIGQCELSIMTLEGLFL